MQRSEKRAPFRLQRSPETMLHRARDDGVSVQRAVHCTDEKTMLSRASNATELGEHARRCHEQPTRPNCIVRCIAFVFRIIAQVNVRWATQGGRSNCNLR